MTTERLISFFSGRNQWLMHYELHQALFSDNRLMNLGHILKTHSKNTSTVLFFALKAAIASCTGVAHWCCRIFYYKCPSWGCLQFHYYSLFGAFFVGCVGFLSQENMTENCDPCESGQISNLIAFSKRPICSALLPRSPKRVLNQRVQNSTKTLLHGKGEDAHDQDWICEPKYPHIKLKWKKRLFLHSSFPIVSSTDLMSVEAASKTKNTPQMLS